MRLRILCAPWTLRKGVEGSLASSSIGRAINSPQRLRQALAILPGGKIHRMADQMDDAGLNDCLWENGINGLGKTLQAVDHGDENVLDPAGLQLVYDAQQNLAPSVCSIQMPRISLVPPGRTPSAR